MLASKILGMVSAEYSRNVASLYDWLSRFNLLANKVMFGSARADLTMHKALRVPDEFRSEYGGGGQRLYIVDRALEAAKLPAAPSVLDAGCGFGGTIFRWHERTSGTYDGLTLSCVQWKVARKEARRRGIDGQCRFHLRSYDEPTADKYDAVVSIEALIHSKDFPRTVRNLASSLKPRGKLVIAEDILLEESHDDPDFNAMRRHWRLSEMPDASAYRIAYAANGLRIVHDADYSDGFQTSTPENITRLEARYRMIRSLVPFSGPRFVAGAFLGGLALERLYQKRLVRYRLIVAQREG